MTIQQLVAYAKIKRAFVDIDYEGEISVDTPPYSWETGEPAALLTIEQLGADVQKVFDAEKKRLHAEGWKTGAKVLYRGLEGCLRSPPYFNKDGVLVANLQRSGLYFYDHPLNDMRLVTQ
jgi:hypothetical protein